MDHLWSEPWGKKDSRGRPDPVAYRSVRASDGHWAPDVVDVMLQCNHHRLWGKD